VYGSRESIVQSLDKAIETIRGFWMGYVLAPLRDIISTVRTGGDDGLRIVSKDGLKADMESLERMTKALAAEKLGYTPAQLRNLSEQIRVGDLTPVLQVYEQDLKTPVKSALTGTLIRSLLIQVQKTKVDIDLAMTGIDKLLRSQELTFAFVGVAPSMAILYVVVGWLRWLLLGRGERGKGKTKAVWLAIRRIERLLNSHSHSSHSASHIPPLTQGLILMSLTQLRSYGETCLPPRSHSREGFLQDVEDLESPDLGRQEKLQVVQRMWRSWGQQLEWGYMQ